MKLKAQRLKLKPLTRPWLFLVLIVPCLSVWQVQAACRNPHIVQDSPYLRPAAASGKIEIKWFGHSFFQLTSSEGTKIITDPFGAMGFPMPEVWPNVVTVGREHGNHNNVGLAKGNPVPFWIPAFAGMTTLVSNNDAVDKCS